MKQNISVLIARQFWKSAFHTRALYGILAVIALMLGYAAYTGWKTYTTQNGIREHYQHAVRESWENNPDKHPHRMAHYGSFAFRIRHPLSMFDFGLESFTGNAVYLEAHKQNTVNFSEASFSTGLLRFGEISMALLLQVVLPLFILFLGFNAVSSDRENGTLKVMLVQGAGWKDILLGRSMGLMAIVLLVLIPVVVTFFVLLLTTQTEITIDVWLRYAGIVIAYLIFLQVICIITIVVSAASTTSKSALMKLLALWLFLAILLPRTTQAIGSYRYPSPSKIEFDTRVEEDVLKEGDSHDPDDPHYKHLRDSVLRAHKVDSVEQLPFNYSGFVMREGEKISAEIYNRHLKELLRTYNDQNNLAKISAFINPYSAIRNISMALSGTDFGAYVAFQNNAEAYRYQLAQTMNELQMEYISNRKPGPDDKPYTISRDHWRDLPDFHPEFISVGTALRNEALSVVALLCWSVFAVALVVRMTQKAKVI